MPRVMIWPDVYKEPGHWLPCINLAASLQTAGYTVEFMGIPDCASIVAPYNATFHTILESIYPLGHSVENKLEPLDQRWKPHHVLPIARGALDGLFTGEDAPDLLIGGYFTGLETLLIHRLYDIPFVIITTFLRHPDDTPALHAKTKLVYMSQALSQKIIDAVSPPESNFDIDAFVEPLEVQPEIIPCPREFDFYDEDWVHGETTHYVEPMIERRTLDTDDPLPDPTSGIVPPSARIIFGTAGSQVQDYEFKARLLFRNLIAMMQTQRMGDFHLVLAVGDRLLAQLRIEYGVDTGKSTLPSNVSLFSWVSQLDILKRAEVVFMHGGLATIKESIWEQVPIVVVPHGKDQMDNALRIRRSKIGIVSEVEDASPLLLRKLLTDATTNNWIHRGLSKLQAIFLAREIATPKPSVQIISAVVPP